MELLTTKKAEELKGKKIRVAYSGYAEQGDEDVFVVGEICSKWDLAKNNKDFNGFKNQQDYWGSYMTDRQIETQKDERVLLKSDGTSSFCRVNKWSDGNVQQEDDSLKMTKEIFWASDEDRCVSFEILENITLTQLSEEFKGNLWEKGDNKRLYLDRGYNTKKMKTTTYVYEQNGGFIVKCFIDCPSQSYEWIKSQQEEVILYVEGQIEELINPSDEEVVIVEKKDKGTDIVDSSELISSFIQLGSTTSFIFTNELKERFTVKLFGTPYQKVTYSFSVEGKYNKKEVIKGINNHYYDLEKKVNEVEKFKEECKELIKKGYRICGNSLLHGQAQIMHGQTQSGHIHGTTITLNK